MGEDRFLKVEINIFDFPNYITASLRMRIKAIKSDMIILFKVVSRVCKIIKGYFCLPNYPIIIM